MLTSLSIGNFKAFGGIQKVPIRPITLIFGANSSGKSSLIHALLLTRHALETGDWNARRTALGGDSVDLGGFGAYVHRQRLETPVTLHFDLAIPADSTNLPEALRLGREVSLEIEVGAESDYCGNRLREGAPRVLRGRVRAGDSELVSFVHRQAEPLVQALGPNNLGALDQWARRGYRIERLSLDHPVFQAVAESQESRPDEDWMLRESLPRRSDLAWESLQGDIGLVADAGDLIPRRIEYLGGDADLKAQWARPSLPETRVGASCRLLRSLERLLEAVNGLLTRDLRSLQYLGPLRSLPPRYFEARDPSDANWVAGGAFAWEVVRRDEAVRGEVNKWLGPKGSLQVPYALTTRSWLDLEGAKSAIARELRAIRRDFPNKDMLDTDKPAGGGPAKDFICNLCSDKSLEWRRSLALLDQRNGAMVSHRDVGIGISQVLPVLVQAYGNQQKLVAIEQPEIHLHPGMQAELGDVFIESALGERRNTFLIETHSEHLILRIMRRIRETHLGKLPKEKNLAPVKPTDVAVLYVERDGDHGLVREFPLNERGDLVKAWPGGFFEEGLREMLP